MGNLLAFRTNKNKTQAKQIQTKSKVQETITVNTFDKRIDLEMSANNQSGFVGFLAFILVILWFIASIFRRREKRMTRGQTLPKATNYDSTIGKQTFNYYIK